MSSEYACVKMREEGRQTWRSSNEGGGEKRSGSQEQNGCWTTIHPREFRHIMKPSLIAPSTLVPTTPLFTEVCHQPFTEDQ